MLFLAIRATSRTIKPSITRSWTRNLSQSAKRQSDVFPLTKPSWSVNTLLNGAEGIKHPEKLDGELDQARIRRLYELSGLQLPDPAVESERYKQISEHVNQLKDFLGHIQAVEETDKLDGVVPLMRIAEVLEFTIEEPNAGLVVGVDSEAHLGRRVLELAAKTSGDYLIVEE
ncbi:hypothetical protein BX661DRAFT_225291 [Kickxella alabastrina]|uniref:uncharacterized protein n=1 Tax=Kickxella alabastrina TaxID=61397 RepID=UPI0022202F77|nr:uncharacterized protein BX661DRAFT_225291 [Kickxella alabastrina]KAI7825890.1 hypothetical protein BX661DRAFT_225291 [Kickxella alabastrina]KAJ1947258.1 hypothetical protein GGF37_000560 [Kickxella alabastrina]